MLKSAARNTLNAIPLIAILFLSAIGAQAGEASLATDKDDTVGTVLRQHIGKTVTLKLSSGQDLTGKVQQVGNHLVVLASLRGLEFYDAAVELAHVSAVVVRVRNK